MKGKYLITTDNWFVAPDGKQYAAVWGEVETMDDSILGIKTNRNASNWYVRVGNEENHIIIAGCQIHYAVKCEKPHSSDIEDYTVDNATGIHKFTRPTRIYIVE
jgi:hypothetical protein